MEHGKGLTVALERGHALAASMLSQGAATPPGRTSKTIAPHCMLSSTQAFVRGRGRHPLNAITTDEAIGGVHHPCHDPCMICFLLRLSKFKMDPTTPI